jgi:iron complex transport system permease protein
VGNGFMAQGRLKSMIRMGFPAPLVRGIRGATPSQNELAGPRPVIRLGGAGIIRESGGVDACAKKHLGLLAALAGLALALAFLSVSFGSYDKVRAPEVWQVLAHLAGLGRSQADATAESVVTAQHVVLDLRLPRVVLGILAGAALGMAGAALQGLFRNPLADPALIGVSGGAALGAVVVIVLGGAALRLPTQLAGAFALPMAAMAGGVAVTFLIYHLAKVEGRTHVALMLLTGLALNALAGAAIGLLVYLATDEQLREFMFWSLGSLSRADWPQIGAATVFIIPALMLLPRLARPLNALALGEAEAHHLGVPVQQLKRRLIFLSAVMVGASVAACGTIGFVGLVAPHLARLLFGPDHRLLLPASALLGAVLLLAADIIARFGTAGFEELPIGVVTALAGAPIFLAMLLRARRKGEF